MFRPSGISKSGLFPLLLVIFALSGCQQSAGPATGVRVGAPAPATVVSAITQPTPTPVPVDTTKWPQVQRTVQGLTFSYRYPPGWSADLAYCMPGAAPTQDVLGDHLPRGCISTDLLVGRKARDVGNISGTPFTVSGKSGMKLLDGHPVNPQVARVYTVMLYNARSVPLVGFSTSFGIGTDPTTLDDLTAMLDQVVATFRVGSGG